MSANFGERVSIASTAIIVGARRRAAVSVSSSLMYFSMTVSCKSRVDVAQPLGENFGLGASDRRMQCDQLPVDIGFGAHGVGVGDGEAARTGAYDHLGGVGPHAAQSHDAVRAHCRNRSEFFLAEQQLGAFKSSYSIVAGRICRS